MKNPLESLHLTLLLGLVLAIVALLLLHTGVAFSGQWWLFFFRWLHVLTAILWIGLLYYFNFVQMPSMPKISPESGEPNTEEKGIAIIKVAVKRARYLAIIPYIRGHQA